MSQSTQPSCRTAVSGRSRRRCAFLGGGESMCASVSLRHFRLAVAVARALGAGTLLGAGFRSGSA
eukprot:292962-Chlamydomonas_euryale.AAC.1